MELACGKEEARPQLEGERCAEMVAAGTAGLPDCVRMGGTLERNGGRCKDEGGEYGCEEVEAKGVGRDEEAREKAEEVDVAEIE